MFFCLSPPGKGYHQGCIFTILVPLRGATFIGLLLLSLPVLPSFIVDAFHFGLCLSPPGNCFQRGCIFTILVPLRGAAFIVLLLLSLPVLCFFILDVLQFVFMFIPSGELFSARLHFYNTGTATR